MINREEYESVKNALSDYYILKNICPMKLTKKKKGFFTKKIQYRQTGDIYYQEEDVCRIDIEACEILKMKKYTANFTGLIIKGYLIKHGTVVFLLVIQSDGYSYIHSPFTPAPSIFDSLIYSEV